ncbi:excinuclease ABC subunit UvrA [Amphibiibacter pelophylacis]|uniref:Excinuclease ABC subunit UvrA n=1 Tax=Amphibiibacter pelophylacis TaxID=1799477 RepID=A0ACC6P2M1_9BURK
MSDSPSTPRPASALTHICVRGARTHNLRNLDIDLPKNALVVITGLSGSGKSSLAFDTLYAEGQRRYVESLSAYARQFLQLMGKPDVDVIEGLSPAIAIEQKATSHNPRSTVGTVTEIHDYLRLLYARVGTPHCPDHGHALASQSVAQMVDALLAQPEGTRLMVLAPVQRGRKGEGEVLFEQMQARGYVRFRVNGEVAEAGSLPRLAKHEKHDIDVVVDRIKIRPDIGQRLAESLEAALLLADGKAIALDMDSGQETLFSSRYACPVCDYALAELEPRLFSFNSPQGACSRCDGLGHITDFDRDRVVAFPQLSLASGAIKGWEKRNPYTWTMLKAVAAHFVMDLEAPFASLSPRHQDILLYGSGDEAIRFTYTADGPGGRSRHVEREHPFEGIIPNWTRRYRETDSAAVRDELARCQSSRPCPDCAGARLRREARHVVLPCAGPLAADKKRTGVAIFDLGRLNLAQCHAYFEALHFDGAKAQIAGKIVREIASRLRFLNDVGLNYLSLERSADTLSGGEAQRIRLASQIGSGLTGVMYVLDEPSIGLHQRDNERLIATLRHLRDLGNTVIVVEHDEDMIRAADWVLDMGPGAGVHGGRVLAEGPPEVVAAHPDSITGRYLSGERRVSRPAMSDAGKTSKAPTAPKAPKAPAQAEKVAKPGKSARAAPTRPALRITGARGNNLKNVSVDLPLGEFICVTGVSGSGKSTLINDTLHAAAARLLHHAHTEAAPHDTIEGLDAIDKVINVDQSPIGRTPRSNPATYTGLFTPIRELFADLPTSRERGYGPGRFSFNVAGGRCEACQGDGMVKVEMHFLPDVYVPCDICQGARYSRETLEVRYKGLNIHEVLGLTVEDALALFGALPALQRKLQTLMDVGLGYITLGQSATTLSGGEAQRVKLALELSKRDTGRTLYILDEPTTGLHFADIDQLLQVLHQLHSAGNTLVVIEHNLDVIRNAGWVIDMGPEGGSGGGQVVATGTPRQIADHPASHTGRFLKAMMG